MGSCSSKANVAKRKKTQQQQKQQQQQDIPRLESIQELSSEASDYPRRSTAGRGTEVQEQQKEKSFVEDSSNLSTWGSSNNSSQNDTSIAPYSLHRRILPSATPDVAIFHDREAVSYSFPPNLTTATATPAANDVPVLIGVESATNENKLLTGKDVLLNQKSERIKGGTGTAAVARRPAALSSHLPSILNPLAQDQQRRSEVAETTEDLMSQGSVDSFPRPPSLAATNVPREEDLASSQVLSGGPLHHSTRSVIPGPYLNLDGYSNTSSANFSYDSLILTP